MSTTRPGAAFQPGTDEDATGDATAGEVRWLDQREQRAWRRYLLMAGELAARMSRELTADAGISLADYDVLVHLGESPGGRRRVSQLARGLSWEQSRLSHQVARMQRRGLVAREECADDGRGALVVLTSDGRRALERAAPAHVTFVREHVFDALAPEQVEALDAIAAAVLARLSEQ